MAKLNEIQQIEECIAQMGDLVRSEILAYSEVDALNFPIYKMTFGSKNPQAPTLGFIGGVHGLERIGSQVCLSFMNSLSELVRWDESFQRTLNDIRIYFIPTVNPVGIYKKTRSNPRGVDLMRNAPVEADKAAKWVGGQRYSNRLPWYRGHEGEAMEVESQALINAVEKEISQSPLSITLDIHSGFGFEDRLWFPYAKTIEPFPDLGLAYSLKQLLDRTYPHHFYRYEPQAQSYTTHGDLWDYLYDRKRTSGGGTYLPLCLEMGSWLWVKKNPWQIFSADGPFNPQQGHRHQRILRRHNTLMDFLVRAIASRQAWAVLSHGQENEFQKKARGLWYATT
ncbi:MAG: M14 family zinc carboxypeptidase [Pseudobdellovibrionaceae bacterium]